MTTFCKYDIIALHKEIVNQKYYLNGGIIIMAKTFVDCVMSMKKKDLDSFKRLYSAKGGDPRHCTVAEYIATHNVRTETRVSKKGIPMIKVFYENGVVKEYPAHKLTNSIVDKNGDVR